MNQLFRVDAHAHLDLLGGAEEEIRKAVSLGEVRLNEVLTSLQTLRAGDTFLLVARP